MEEEYRVILTDRHGDVTYIKTKAELGGWLAGINFDVVTHVNVELLGLSELEDRRINALRELWKEQVDE